MTTKNSLTDVIGAATSLLEKSTVEQTLKATMLAKAWKPALREWVAKTVKEIDGEYCVIGESGKNFGCYKSKKEAEERLAEIKQFSEKADSYLEKFLKMIEEKMGDEIPVFKSDADAPEMAGQLARSAKNVAFASKNASAREAYEVLRDLAEEFEALTKGVVVEKEHHGDKDKGKDKKRRRRRMKGLPAESAEGGIHIHGLERNNSKTKIDGPHDHVFILTANFQVTWPDGYVDTFPPGTMLFTECGGSHEHSLSAPAAERTDEGGEHFHAVSLPGGEVLETSDDGAHSHELQVGTTSFDGVHTHVLEMENQTLTSMTPAQFWEFMGMPSQDHIPPVPAAHLFAWLHPDARAALMAMHSVETLKQDAEDDTRTEAVKSEFRRGTVGSVKMPDPRFIMKRLKMQKSAALVSSMVRKSRLDEPQALVNELKPLGFEGSFVWGVVSHGAAEVYKSWEEVPEEVRESIDPHTAATYENNLAAQVCVHPLTLVKSFDEPLKLKKAPGGRRFAAKVDLEADIADVVKCQECSAPYENLDDGFALCSDCRKLDTRIAKAARVGRHVKIVKAEETEEERTVFGVVLVPDEADAQDDTYTADEVKKAAYGYLEVFGGKMKLMHKGETLDEGLVVLESYVSKSVETFDDDEYPVGTWFMTARVKDDEIWEGVKKGDFTGFSMGGSAIREALA